MNSSLSVAIYLYEPSDGGLDRVAILLANYLARHGVRAELWMARVDGPLASMIDPGVVIRKVATASTMRGVAMLTQLPVLRGMLRRHRPDILFSAGNQSNLLVACAALGMRTQAVGRISNPIVRPGTRGPLAWLRRKRFQLTAWLSCRTIVMGGADADLLAGNCGAIRRKVALLPRPTVTPVLSQAGERRRLARPGARRELLAVGRLAPQKDHRTMLAALALLNGHDWRLRVAGQGPLLPRCNSNAGIWGLPTGWNFWGSWAIRHDWRSYMAVPNCCCSRRVGKD